MHIVILDGCTLNPGDLSWEALRALGPCATLAARHSLMEVTIANVRAFLDGRPQHVVND